MKRKHSEANCEVCPLQKNYFAPSSGNREASIALVGESPGRDSRGLSNFIDILMDEPIEELFITNACLCNPVGGPPPQEAIDACKPRLIYELQEVQPETVMLLGSTALKAILGADKKITQERVGPPREFEGFKVIPTYHPSASLYNASVFPDIVRDFDKIHAYPMNWEPPMILIPDNQEDIDDALKVLDQYEVLAFDVEVEIDKDGIDVSPKLYDLLCIGVGTKAAVIVFTADFIDDKLVELLAKKKLIAHNGKFDINAVRSLTESTPSLWFDTMLASYALDERSGVHSLRTLAMEYLGAPDWKDVVKQFGGHNNLPLNFLYEYNAIDVANTYALYEVLYEQLDRENLVELHDFLVESSNTLMDVEYNGIAIDEDYIDELNDVISEQMQSIRDKINELLGVDNFNPNSWQQVQKVLEVLDHPTQDTQAGTLENIMNHTDDEMVFDFIKLVLEHRKCNKLLGTYVKGMKKRIHEGRINTSYRLHGTTTGRLSSRNPNLQNIPRNSEIKKIFIAEPDHKLVQIDYSQAELRAVAWLAQDEYLRGVFNEGRDIHSEVAATLFGPKFTKEQRVKAKGVVFGLTYGMGAYYMSHLYDLTIKEAERYIATWFSMIPSTVAWINTVHKTILRKQELQSPFGHKMRVPLITDRNRKDILKSATAFLPQNIASNICLSAANRIRKQGYGNLIRLLVHDAIVFELDSSLSQLECLRQIMEQTGRDFFNGYVDTPVDVAVGSSWGDLE